MSEEHTTPIRVGLAEHARAALTRAARLSPGAECAGVLLGSLRDGALAITGAVQLPNRAAQPSRRFRLDPHDILMARGTHEQRIGFWHTHPHANELVLSDDDRCGHEQYLRVVPGRIRLDRLLVVLSARPRLRCAAYWFSRGGWRPIPTSNWSESGS